MTSRDLPVPARVLAIGAHPDDVEFGCGATLAKWADAGASIELLVLTDGSKGSWDPAADVVSLVGTRRDEQRHALDALGAQDVHFLDRVDGELGADLETRGAVCRVLRTVRPDVVLGHDPWKRYRLHPDHHHAGQLTIDGIVAARDPHFYRDAGAPHRPQHLLLFEADAVDHLEAVGRFLAAKVDALLCHRSQWRSTMGIEADAPSEATQLEAFRRRIEQQAMEHGPPAAEAFKRIDDL